MTRILALRSTLPGRALEQVIRLAFVGAATVLAVRRANSVIAWQAGMHTAPPSTPERRPVVPVPVHTEPADEDPLELDVDAQVVAATFPAHREHLEEADGAAG